MISMLSMSCGLMSFIREIVAPPSPPGPPKELFIRTPSM